MSCIRLPAYLTDTVSLALAMVDVTRRGVLGAGAGGSPFLFLRRRFRIMSSTENRS